MIFRCVVFTLLIIKILRKSEHRSLRSKALAGGADLGVGCELGLKEREENGGVTRSAVLDDRADDRG